MPLWRLHYHLIWATGGREAIIDDGLAATLEASLQRTCRRLQVVVHAIGWMPDHVHLAVSIPPKHAVSDVVRALKGASSHDINQASPARFGWQGDYGAFTFSDRGLTDVVDYVANQKERHAAGTLFAALEQTGPQPL